MTESRNEESDDEYPTQKQQECPLCGQPYDHKLKYTEYHEPNLRKDATVCKTAPVGNRRTAYIHVQ